MEIMKLNTSKSLKWTLLATSLLAISPANAQAIGALCNIITFVKGLIGATAVLAILCFVINSFFSKNSLFGDIIQTVLIGCLVAVGAVALVTASGLTVGCA